MLSVPEADSLPQADLDPDELWQQEQERIRERPMKLWRSGISIIPLCWPEDGRCACPAGHTELADIGKAPVVSGWKQYATRRPERQTVLDWAAWYPDANWGVICGQVSGLVVLDFDGPEGLALWRRKFGGEPPGLCLLSGSGNGRHYYLRWREGARSFNLMEGGQKICEVRSDGRYVVGPGGNHREGGVYRPDPASVPQTLLDKIWRGEVNVPALPEVPDFLILPESVVPAAGPAAGGLVNEEAPEWIREALADEEAALQRYPSRSEALFGIIRSLVNRGWPDEQIIPLLMESAWAHRRKRNPEAYFAREIERCRDKTEALAAETTGYDIVIGGGGGMEIEIATPAQEKDSEVTAPPAGGELPAPEGWPTLRDEAYWGPAGEFASMLAPWTEADPVSLLAQALTALGNVFGPESHFLIGATQHPARLYTVICGESAKGRKGTSWSYVREFMRMIDPAWADHLGGTLSSGEGLIHSVRDPGKVRDGKGRLIDDPGVPDKRLLAYESEFANVFSQVNRDTNTLSSLLRQFWDEAGTVRSLTKIEPEKTTGAHISVIGHITVHELKSKMTDLLISNGLGNRFLWVLSRRRQLLAFGEDISNVRGALAGVAAKVRASQALARSSKRQIRWGAEAARRWEPLYYQMAATTRSGRIGSLTARGETQIIRLALLYALLDGETEIGIPHLEAAVAFWEYCQASVEWIWGRSHTGGEDGDVAPSDLSEALLQVIRDSPGIKQSDLTRDLSSSSGVPVRDLIPMLKELEQSGQVYMKKLRTGGRGRVPICWFPA